MKKYIFPDKLEIVNIVVAIIGIGMIICSSLCTAEQGTLCSKLLSIIGDLGIGIFPTGIIGFILERIQNRNKAQEMKSKRLAILRLFNNAVHGYLNVICNTVIEKESSLKNKKVFEIITTLNNDDVQVECSSNEKVALSNLVEKLHELFDSDNPLYIVTDVFEMIEINHFELIIKDGEKLLCLMKENRSIKDSRNTFLSYLWTTCLEIPECYNFNLMISDGDNIFIPSR